MAYDDLSYPRSRGLGLIDEEEEEELRRRRASIGALDPRQMPPMAAAAPSMARSEGPMRPTMASLLPQPDAELDARWRDAETSALDRAQPESFGVAEGLRDFAPMAIGGTLDILLNKGRGLGELTAGGMQAIASENMRRDKAREQAGNYALRVKGQREAGGDRLIQAQHAALRGEGMDLERQQLELQRQKFAADQGDPEQQRRAKEAEIALRQSQTNENEASAYSKWTTDPNAIDAETQARLKQQREMHGEDLAERRAGRAETAAYRGEMAEGRKDAAATRAAVEKDKRDTRDATAFLDKTKPDRAMAAGIQAVEPIIDNPKYATDLPGRGMFDQNVPSWVAHPFDSQARADSDTIKSQAGEAYVYFRNKISGAAFGKAEDEDYRAIKGLSKGGTEQEFRNAMARWKTALQNDLKARVSVSPEANRQALDAQGLGAWTYGNEPPPAAAEPPPASGYNPDTNGLADPNDPNTLEVTGRPGVRNTPDFAGGASRYRAGNGRAQAAGDQPMSSGTMNADTGKRLMTVQSPDGSTEQLELSEDEAEYLRSQKARVF